MELYYLQDSRFFLGNTVVWWATDGGYTVDTSKARTYTKEEADSLHATRETDVPWPKDYIDTKTRPTVDLLDIERRDAMRSLTIIGTRLPQCSHCDDVMKEATCAQFKCDKWTIAHGVWPKKSEDPALRAASCASEQEVSEKSVEVLETSKPIS